MGIEGANPRATPAEMEALPADKMVIFTEPSLNYASFIGMIQYLQGQFDDNAGAFSLANLEIRA